MKPYADYKNKCGMCKYFTYLTKKGEITRYGHCEHPAKRYPRYKQACQTKCLKYEEWKDGDDIRF